MIGKVRLCEVLTRSRNCATLFAYSSSVKEGRKEENYVFIYFSDACSEPEKLYCFS